MSIGQSLAKPRENQANEDSIRVEKSCIAVSDGAGGCGVFADEWSAYLVHNLPISTPFSSYKELNDWLDQIWEPFFETHERKAQAGDAMLLEKYYREGSFATLAAAWHSPDGTCRWATFGDSVVFHYSRKKGTLEHSFGSLAEFAKPPHLINCKEPLEEEGFHSGTFVLDDSSMVFVASDALSHYIIMCYELSHCSDFYEQLMEERNAQNSNAQLLAVAERMPVDFDRIMDDLRQSVQSELTFAEKMCSLQESGVLDKDDYSLVFLDIAPNTTMSVLPTELRTKSY